MQTIEEFCADNDIILDKDTIVFSSEERLYPMEGYIRIGISKYEESDGSLSEAFLNPEVVVSSENGKGIKPQYFVKNTAIEFINNIYNGPAVLVSFSYKENPYFCKMIAKYEDIIKMVDKIYSDYGNDEEKSKKDFIISYVDNWVLTYNPAQERICLENFRPYSKRWMIPFTANEFGNMARAVEAAINCNMQMVYPTVLVAE